MRVEQLIDDHKDSVYRQLVRTCGNYEDAEDALVESLMQAYLSAGQLQNPDAFRGWVGTIARRVCQHIQTRDDLRNTIPMAEMETTADPQLDVDQEVAMRELKRHVKAAIAGLESPYAETYQLVEIEGMNLQEAADKEGITLAALKSRLHRARQSVREYLDAHFVTPE